MFLSGHAEVGLHKINVTSGDSITPPDPCVRINTFSSLRHHKTPKWVLTSRVPLLRLPQMNLNSGTSLQSLCDDFADGIAPDLEEITEVGKHMVVKAKRTWASRHSAEDTPPNIAVLDSDRTR